MRLVAFGCSLTYGQNMPDNIVQSNPGKFDNPSCDSWPSKLADLLNVPVINHGVPGASGKEIWGKTLCTDLQKDDLVVILWTHPDRWCTFTSDQSMQDKPRLRAQPAILTHPKSFRTELVDYNRAYYGHVHDEYDAAMDIILRANHIYDVLSQKGIRSYHYRMRKSWDKFKPEITDWNRVPFSKTLFRDIRKKYPDDLALDNSHPGALVYAEFAAAIYREIKDELH
jgi:lysophospholipase L1-like esterase